MIPSAYLDTSAFLRLFLQEVESDVVAAAVQGVTTLFASRLVLTEARVTLARAQRDGRLSPQDYRVTLDAVDLFWEAEIEVVELTEESFISAEHVAEIQTLRTLDALHLGTARLLRKELALTASIAFIACDNRLLQAAATLGFPTPIPPNP